MRRVLAVLLLVLSVPVLPKWAIEAWTLDGTPRVVWQRTDSDAVFIAGGGVSRDGRGLYWPSIETYRRGVVGADVARRLSIPMVLSGGPTLDRDKTTEAEVLSRYLATDVPILMDDRAMNSWENAVGAQRIRQENGWTGGYILVSDGIHLRRLAACMRALDVPIDAVVPTRSRRVAELRWVDFVPSVSGLTAWSQLSYELMGSIYYILRGRISPADLVAVTSSDPE
ncbi:YdcF family protein [Pacificispira spongiicola]|uniref:YdcF family protein n=1 Tax=Pacificispira spongiicola TaxID=2729598 RepID=UPI00146F28FD|nr:YdcF family protein [Pacificispira spongiicola]